MGIPHFCPVSESVKSVLNADITYPVVIILDTVCPENGALSIFQ